jgi:hypothetical protein
VHHSPRPAHIRTIVSLHKNRQCRLTTNPTYCHQRSKPRNRQKLHTLQCLLPLLLPPHLPQLANCPLSWRSFRPRSTSARSPTVLENREHNAFGAPKTFPTTRLSCSFTYAACLARESPFALLRSLKSTSRGTLIDAREWRRARTRELVSFVYIFVGGI